jgi:hypothetical protein
MPELAGGSDAYGVWLYGSAESLRQLAGYIRSGWSGTILLAGELIDAPSGHGWWTSDAEPANLKVVAIRTAAEPNAPVDIQAVGDVLSIAGGSIALSVLADSIDNLASDDVLTGPVDRHMSFASVAGDGWQSSSSQELTAYHVASERLRRR